MFEAKAVLYFRRWQCAIHQNPQQPHDWVGD